MHDLPLGLLAAAGREKLLNHLEIDMGQQLVRTLRGMIWLKVGHDSLPREKVLEAAEKLNGGPLEGVRLALDLLSHHGMSEFKKLYQDVERLAGLVE